jgi:hypothetical protein
MMGKCMGTNFSCKALLNLQAQHTTGKRLFLGWYSLGVNLEHGNHDIRTMLCDFVREFVFDLIFSS